MVIPPWSIISWVNVILYKSLSIATIQIEVRDPDCNGNWAVGF